MTLGSQSLKRDRNQAQESTQDAIPPAKPIMPNGSPAAARGHEVNGDNVLTNGVHSPAEIHALNGTLGVEAMLTDGPSDPPALDRSWRSGDSNKSLGVMLERVAQKCYHDLSKTLTEMSQIEISTEQNQPNGLISHQGEDTSVASLEKKRKFLEFAKEQRDRFIKLLVLADWSSRSADDIAKTIDIVAWANAQSGAQFGAIDAIHQTKSNMDPAKVPNPNIDGAMELLATSKASWIPNLGYIQPKRLTANELLKTLRGMNVTLATRLNLHTELPPHFRHFTIADGRATFRVEEEFEVDLSVAEEDPATPFYFIDIRLLFTPSAAVLDDRLRSYMEAKVNQELANKGLKGCYDFLHNFVITHKINVLRSQAATMVQDKWFDCIRTESMRRSFVVQYWAALPGPKSWVEVGISSGKAKTVRPGHQKTPHISLRWFRKGVEVNGQVPQLDLQVLDLEKSVLHVISAHIRTTLDELKDRMIISSRGLSSMTVAVEDSQSNSPTLVLWLSALATEIRVHIEPVTGQFSITPASVHAAHAEKRINADPSADAAKRLMWLVCVSVQDRVRKQAELLGWKAIPNLTKQDNLPKLFGEPVRHISVYTPAVTWGSTWALAAAFDLSGPLWFAVQLVRSDPHIADGSSVAIRSVHRISEATALPDCTESRASLSRIQKSAVVEIAFGALSKQLTDMQVPYRLETSTAEIGQDDLGSSSPAMFIRSSALLQPPKVKDWKPWAADLVRLTHRGAFVEPGELAHGVGSMRHDLRITLEPGFLKDLQKRLTRSEDRNLVINRSGGLALRITTPFGEPFVEHIVRHLRSLERLDRFVSILQQRGLKPTHVSTSRLAFVYANGPELSAQLQFPPNSDTPVRLKLLPAGINPHRSVRSALEQLLNRKLELDFEMLAFLLSFTLPAWTAINQLSAQVKHGLTVHVRSGACYSLKYHVPYHDCGFLVQARARFGIDEGSTVWRIERLTSKAGDDEPSADLVKALAVLWERKGDDWERIGNGIVAGMRGIAAALLAIDDTVRRFRAPKKAVIKSDGDVEPTQDMTDTSNGIKGSNEEALTANGLTAAASVVKDEPEVIMID